MKVIKVIKSFRDPLHARLMRQSEFLTPKQSGMAQPQSVWSQRGWVALGGVSLGFGQIVSNCREEFMSELK
jgi:hypothetical protein